LVDVIEEASISAGSAIGVLEPESGVNVFRFGFSEPFHRSLGFISSEVGFEVVAFDLAVFDLEEF
jgi:hypothetical protein